jgi:hypothetical protein
MRSEVALDRHTRSVEEQSTVHYEQFRKLKQRAVPRIGIDNQLAVRNMLRKRERVTSRASVLAFRATGPKLGELFDGSEKLVGMTSTPTHGK